MDNKLIRIIIGKSPAMIIGCLGVIFGSTNLSILALGCFLVLVMTQYGELSSRTDSLASLGMLTLFWSLGATSIYIFGQFVTPLPHFVIRVTVFSILATSVSRTNTSPIGSRAIYKILIGVFLLLMLVKSLSRVGLGWLISFIGFGYDNYGHLSIFRTILIEGKSIFALSHPEKYVTFVGASPIGGHIFFTLLADTIGINGEVITTSVFFYASVLILMPVGMLFVAFKILCRHQRTILWRSIGLLGLSLVVVGGYPSHIWFSGYFSSNFATLIVLMTVGVSLSSISINSKLWLTTSLVVVTFTVYSIYAVFAAVVVIAILIGHRQQIIPDLRQVSKQRWILVAINYAYYGLLIYLTLAGLRSGYGSNQFLADGGIAPLPIGTTMFIFGLAGSLLLRPQLTASGRGVASLVAQGLIILATVCMIYAHFKLAQPGQPWYIPYYPAKLAIMVILIVMILLIDQALPLTHLRSEDYIQTIQNTFFVVASVIALVVAGHNDWPFSGSFMGSTTGVVESIINDDPKLIEGSIIMDWVGVSNKVGRPVLILMKDLDAELPTRWVNSLTFRWTDENWGPWMSANNYIKTGDFSEATKILSDKFLLITNQKQLVESLQGADSSLEVCESLSTLSGSCDIYYNKN